MFGISFVVIIIFKKKKNWKFDMVDKMYFENFES